MYSEKASPSSDVYLPKGPKPVFLRSDNVRNYDRKTLTGEEIYIGLAKTVHLDSICGIQEIRSLWRIYLSSQEARVKLITDGLELRGALTPIYDLNPFTQSREENLTRVVIKDIPLSVSDDLIRLELQTMKQDIKGDIIRQKLRVTGQLINCLNGDRVLYITPPSQPIPRKITIGNIFRTRVYHNGQPTTNTGTPTCSRCLEKGHHVSQCNNAVKCQTCRKDGHVRSECPEGNRHTARGATQAADSQLPKPRDTPDEPNRDGRNDRSNESRDSGRRQTSLADFLPKHTDTQSPDPPVTKSADARPTSENASNSSATMKLRSHGNRPDTEQASDGDCSTYTSCSESESEDTVVTSPETPTPPKEKHEKRKPKKRKMQSNKKK